MIGKKKKEQEDGIRKDLDLLINKVENVHNDLHTLSADVLVNIKDYGNSIVVLSNSIDNLSEKNDKPKKLSVDIDEEKLAEVVADQVLETVCHLLGDLMENHEKDFTRLGEKIGKGFELLSSIATQVTKNVVSNDDLIELRAVVSDIIDDIELMKKKTSLGLETYKGTFEQYQERMKNRAKPVVVLEK